MDESSDFHEKKDFANHKRLPKSKSTLKKKPAKKIKGQKDIRTALKSKKNDLISYSKDFDKVCRKSGIDLDSEELQLAIALSKSLNDPVNVTNPSCSSENLNIKDNCNKIRTTLQEYGFTVPEIKIVKNINKRQKHRKLYKLLVTNEVEKKQIILDRFSQIISKTVGLNVTEEENQQCAEINLQHLATNASYERLKDIKIFYVKNLLHISPNSIGSLLKDWSTIPGRPASPTVDHTANFIFKELNCSLTDLDKILSGSIEITQSIIRKITEGFIETAIKNKDKTIESGIMKGIDKADSNSLPTVNMERSCSPDIFDDDLSVNKSYDNTFNEVSIKGNHSMDLTECVSVVKAITTDNKKIFSQSQKANETGNKSGFSQCNNTTKRKTNDFMEITNITSLSQPIIVNYCPIINKDNLQGDQYSITIDDKNNEFKTIDLTHQEITNNKDKQVNLDNVDLTQSSDSNELPAIHLSGTQKDKDQTIILDESEYNVSNTPRKNASTDNVTKNDLGPKDIVTLYSDVDEILDLTLEILKSPSKEYETLDTDEINNEGEIDLTQSNEEIYNSGCNEIKSEANTNQSLPSHKNLDKDEINNKSEIDLTQSNEEMYKTDCKSAKLSYSSLGKSDNMSLDYDEVINLDIYDTEGDNNADLDVNHSQADVMDNFKEEHCTSSNQLDSSQASEVFEIYDNELDYSIQQSRLEMPSEHFEIGGLSILDNISHASHNNDGHKIEETESYRTAPVDNKEVNRSINDKSIEKNDYVSFTPAKGADIKMAIETPKTDYIIKTDQVTPIADYTSMDTPDRNKELEKYGLKPFKRKRAIQLLTHLYNQTHPLVENISKEDWPSPSKKIRTEPYQILQKQSPRKPSKSPNKKSPKVQRDKGLHCENLYKITNETLILEEIVCDPEDYVFQKREKAKIHSCKVPLHIVFYNYLSSRSELKETILRYEPVNIDVIHKDLVAMGYRFDAKDLLKFLDKKCITVKTSDNNSRNHRK